MKLYFLIIACVSLIFAAACSHEHGENAHSPSVDHGTMNHGAMDHSQMKSAPNAADAPYDLQFLDTMIVHHQGAVEMAELVAENTKNAELKDFAVKIFDEQTREIKQMKDWRANWYAGKPSALNMDMPGMRESMKMEMSALKAARDGVFDREFVRQMIPHHEGAISMAKETLTKAEHAELKTLAEQIIKSQTAEIQMMREWQTKWAK